MNNSNVMKIAAGVMLVIAVGLGILVANSYRQSALEAEAAREQARAVELERSQAAPQTLVVVEVVIIVISVGLRIVSFF